MSVLTPIRESDIHTPNNVYQDQSIELFNCFVAHDLEDVF